jgi:hypothetical protein
VILKPAYSITKSRNRDRMLGTIAGVIIGVIILVVVKDKYLMIGCMIVLMVLAYSFMRTRYLLFVTLMTPYILILLYILHPLHFRDLILDRVIDTAIGSGIALIANILFSPEWAYIQFADYLQQMLEANRNYFRDVTSFFIGKPVSVNEYKLSRKVAYVALANISDALNRMLAEPRSKKKNASEYHELVVLNYMMATHIANLALIALGKNPPPPDPEYQPIVHAVISNLDQVINAVKTVKEHALVPAAGTNENPADKISHAESRKANELAERNTDRLISTAIDTGKSEAEGSFAREGLRQLNDRVAEMITVRKKELEQGIRESKIRNNLTLVKSVNDQFNFIWKISEDLLKTLRA